MANKVVGFTINIEGIETINQLNAAISQTKSELKNLVVGTEEYAEKSKELAKLQDELKAINKQQTELQKSLSDTNKNLGAYDQLSARLNKLRKEYKNLAVTEQAATKEAQDLLDEIQRLDKQLKDVDGSVGQFQRNVGNYPKTFARITRSLIGTIPGFEAFGDMLKNQEGNLTGFGKALIGGFVAFQAGKFIIQAIGQLNDLVKKIDETRNAVAGFSGASGEDLNKLTADVTALAQTFGADAKQIGEAAASISEKTGVSFDDALKQIENGLLAGNEATDEFLTNIAEIPEAYQNASVAAGEYTERQQQLLDANKELATAQIEVANAFAKRGTEFAVVGKQLETGLLRVLIFVYDYLKLVVTAWYTYYKTIYDFINLLIPLQTVFDAIISFFTGLPPIMAGVIAAIQQLATNFQNILKTIAIDAQIFGENLKAYFGANVDAAIEDLKRKRDALQKESGSVTKAFLDGYEKQKKESEVTITKDTNAEVKKRQKINIEAFKKQKEESQKQSEQLKKDREKFLQDDLKFREQQSSVILNLQQKTADLIIKNIKDDEQRRLKEAEKTNMEALTMAREQNESLKKLNREREQEAVKLYGEASQQVSKLRSENAQKEIDATKELQAFTIEEEKRYQEEITAIKKDGFDKAIQLRSENFKKSIDAINTEAEAEKTELEKNRLLNLISEEDYQNKLAKITIDRIKKEIEENKKLVETNEKLSAQGIAIDETQNAELLAKNNQLYVDLLNAEKDYTEKSLNLIDERINKSEEEIQKKREQIQKNIETAADYTNQALDLVNSFAQAADEQRNARFEAQEEQNQKAIEDLNERLNTATGLERRYLEQELQREKKNAESIAKAKEEAEKESAKREKAIAIVKSIINTALAVSAALATPPAPNVIAAFAAGIAGAAQTALIAAQPLAKGGVVGKLDGQIVQFASGGKVTNKGNIKPLSNGDNVLATLKTGEVVLNKDQQNRIGYTALKSAKIPGFAAGGVVGAPTALISGTNQMQAEQMQQINTFKDTINAVNGRIDRLQVVYTASTDYDVELSRSDKKTIKANASF